MFRGRNRRAPADNPLPELRHRALHADPTALGMEPTERFPNVFGVVMDTTYANGVATLVAFSDGTTSLYTSTGFGIIGAGSHAQVLKATRSLLRSAETHRDAFVADASDEPPDAGQVTIRLLTFSGRVALTEQEEVLGMGGSVASPVFHAAHSVIAELRQIDESAQRELRH